MEPGPILLASSSPRRLELLAQIGLVPGLILSPAIDETPLRDELPRAYAERLARAKADAASSQSDAAAQGCILIAADTVAALGRRILPKAEDEATARACLALVSGRRHRVITAVVVGPARLQAGQRRSIRVVESVIAFARMTAPQIDALIEAGDWRGKAGGYAVQGAAAAHVRFLSGSYSNVVGLPLFETAQLLRGRGAMA